MQHVGKEDNQRACQQGNQETCIVVAEMQKRRDFTLEKTKVRHCSAGRSALCRRQDIGTQVLVREGGADLYQLHWTARKGTVSELIAEDGRQIYRLYDESNADTFLKYLKDAAKKFGKVAIIVDNARIHTAKKVMQWLAKNKNVVLIPLPKGAP